jgi:hypothetical protein
MKNIVGVDAQFVFYALKKANLDVKFPYREISRLIEQDGDEVLDMFAPVVRFPPQSDDPLDILKTFEDTKRVSHALEQQGVHVIEAPARQMRDKVTGREWTKHSDDQQLMIRLALVCARLKPDFLVLVAADADYAPLLWGLRNEGIRTKLITDPSNVSPELEKAAYSVSNLFSVLQQVG